MGTALVTGGPIGSVVEVSTELIEQGRRVVIFHEFPGNSASTVPEGAEIVFDLDPDGFDIDDIANVYGVDQIYNLDSAVEGGTAPQHLY